MNLSLVLAGGPGSASAARAALEPLARDIGPDGFEELRLLVSELVTNAFEHGGAGPSDQIRLEVAVSAGGVRAEIADRGPGFKPGPSRHSPQDGDRGWGLVMVENVAARWGTKQGGRRVWFELDAPVRPATAAGAQAT